MKILMLLTVYLATTLRSDLAKVYPPGSEPAKGGQTGGLPYAAGKELAHVGNSNLAHDYKDDRTK